MMRNRFKRVTTTAALFILGLTIGAAGCKPASNPAAGGYSPSDEPTDWVEIEMEGGGKIVLELYPRIAPITVANFKKLVGEKFYDGVIFHRVVKGFMIQGGDPLGTGTGGSSERIKGEFSANGVNNTLKHTRGVISMARQSQPMDSASSQFFIMHADAPHLDGLYAAFGKVVSGLEEVDRIANLKVGANDRPIQPPRMKQIRFVKKN